MLKIDSLNVELVIVDIIISLNDAPDFRLAGNEEGDGRRGPLVRVFYLDLM